MYRFRFAGRYAFRFLDRVDLNISTAGDPFIFFSSIKRHRILPCVTPRPNALEGENLACLTIAPRLQLSLEL